MMRFYIKQFITAGILIGVAAACETSDLEAKKEEYNQLKNEMHDLNAKLTALEKEIQEMDPEFKKVDRNISLVDVMEVKPGFFEHRTSVRGSVESRKNVNLTAEVPGRIDKIHVKEGQKVEAGKVLIELDAAVLRNNVAELQTSLELANTLFERQERLWEKNIGTEVQYLEAKNNKESLQRRLATTRSQLNQTILKAPFGGVVDEIPARLGAMAIQGGTLIRLVNSADMYVTAEVSEAFIGKFNTGDSIGVYFPNQDKELRSVITSISNVIHPQNRTFGLEAQLPSIDFMVKPNQVVVLKITDYSNQAAYTIPTNIIQRDDQGHFIYLAEEDDGKSIARKTHIKIGLSNGEWTEEKECLKGGEQVVHKGYRDLSEGAAIALAE